MDSVHLRGILVKLQDRLSDNDRKLLHFFLGNDVPRRIRDDPTLNGTLSLMESLFDQDKINDEDFTFLINAFDEIQCRDAAKILREHMRRMQKNGQNQSPQSLTSILLGDEDEDKCSGQKRYSKVLINQQNISGNNSIIFDSPNVNICPVTTVNTNPSSQLQRTPTANRRTTRKRLLSLSVCLSMTILAIMLGISIARISQLQRKLNWTNMRLADEQDKLNSSLIRSQKLIKQLNRFKQARFISSLSVNARWMQNGLTVAGNNTNGTAAHQLDHPQSIDFDDDKETMFIADCGNHRIVQWHITETSIQTGQVVAGGHGQGNALNQLSRPTDVVFDKETNSLLISDNGNRRVVRWSLRQGTTEGEIILKDIDCATLTIDVHSRLYVSIWDAHEVRRYERGDRNGTTVAGGSQTVPALTQLNGPYYLFVDREYAVYVSDDSHRVTKWNSGAKEGIIVAGGHGYGYALNQLVHPKGIFVDNFDSVYVADELNHRVMRWPKGATEGTTIAGGNGVGRGANQLNRPFDFSFDRLGNLYVVDSYNHRVQCFRLDDDAAINSCDGRRCGCYKGYCWAYVNDAHTERGDWWCYTQKSGVMEKNQLWQTCNKDSHCSFGQTCGNCNQIQGSETSQRTVC